MHQQKQARIPLVIKPIFLLILLFTLCVAPAAGNLQISRVHLTTEQGSFDVQPGEDITISFRLDNEGDERIEDVEVSIVFKEDGQTTLRDEDNEKINLTTKVSSLRPSTSIERELRFRVPYTVEHNTKYVMEVDARGFSENRSQVNATEREDSFTVKKNPHKIIYELFALDTQKIECGNKITLSIIARNIGNDNEEAAVFTVKQPALNIDEQEVFDIDKSYKLNNTWVKKFTFSVPENAKPRTYEIATLLRYGNGNANTTKRIPLEITCVDYREVLDEREEHRSEPEEILLPKSTQQTETEEKPQQLLESAPGKESQQAQNPESMPVELTVPTEPKRKAAFVIIALVCLGILAALIFIILRVRKIRRML